MAKAVYDSAQISVMLNLSTNLLDLPKVWFQNSIVLFALVTALSMLLRSIELAIFDIDTRDSDTGAKSK